MRQSNLSLFIVHKSVGSGRRCCQCWHLNQRPPQVGDTGTIIDILQGPGLPVRYVVESVGSDGATLFLGEFSAEELDEVI